MVMRRGTPIAGSARCHEAPPYEVVKAVSLVLNIRTNSGGIEIDGHPISPCNYSCPPPYRPSHCICSLVVRSARRRLAHRVFNINRLTNGLTFLQLYGSLERGPNSIIRKSLLAQRAPFFITWECTK